MGRESLARLLILEPGFYGLKKDPLRSQGVSVLSLVSET
jgi:hypothetical protein